MGCQLYYCVPNERYETATGLQLSAVMCCLDDGTGTVRRTVPSSGQPVRRWVRDIMLIA